MNLNPHEAKRLAAVLLDSRAGEDADEAGDESGVGAVAGGRLPPGPFGRYRITRLVGLGGMGEVYEAQQETPNRRVAIKVVRPDLISGEALRRFEHETRVLGKLQHPGIAPIFEAGRVEGGSGSTPYFAMEFVDGQPLTKFAAAGKMPLRARLELFLQVCDAVEHAHQKGVIHRDLKPANILVDAGGRPRVMDFGVARATDSDIRATSMHTEVGRLVGTLPYMSPEQVGGGGVADAEELDTRSDVYSLGVVLYELLGGKLPYEVKGVGGGRVADAVRAIRESEPAPLSSVDRVFRGDLETIVGKALEKERGRRYQSVGELAGDIRRYLKDEPIVARRPGTWYQVGKFARRNKGVAISVGALGLVLVSTASISTWFAIKASRATADAQKNEGEAKKQVAVADEARLFLEEMIVSLAPKRLGREAKVIDAVRLAVAKMDKEPMAEPLAEASVRHSAGYALQQLGQYEESIPQLRRALDLTIQLGGGDSIDAAITSRDLAISLMDVGRLAEAEALLTRIVEIRSSIHGNLHAETIASRDELGECLLEQGRFAEAERMLRRGLADAELLPVTERPELASARHNLAAVLMRTRQFDEALPIIQAVVESDRTSLGDRHPDYILSLALLGGVYLEKGELSRAEPILREAHAKAVEVFGESHLQTLKIQKTIAGVVFLQERYEEAEDVIMEVVDRFRESGNAAHPEMNDSVNLWAKIALSAGRADDAARLAKGTLVKLKGEDQPVRLARAALQTTLARAMVRLGESAAAESIAREAWETLASLGIRSGRGYEDSASAMVEVYEALAKPELAAEYREKLKAAQALLVTEPAR